VITDLWKITAQVITDLWERTAQVITNLWVEVINLPYQTATEEKYLWLPRNNLYKLPKSEHLEQ